MYTLAVILAMIGSPPGAPAVATLNVSGFQTLVLCEQALAQYANSPLVVEGRLVVHVVKKTCHKTTTY